MKNLLEVTLVLESNANSKPEYIKTSINKKNIIELRKIQEKFEVGLPYNSSLFLKNGNVYFVVENYEDLKNVL